MTKPRSAPMPAGLRRSRRHPALDYRCPHCAAAPLARCVIPANGTTLTRPHPARLNLWAVTTAVCTTCQTAPGTPCHDEGRALETAHPARLDEAERTAA